MLGDWDRWTSAIAANGSGLGHLEVPREQLESLAIRGRGAMLRQSELIASKQEASKELREVMIEGQRLVTLLRVAVRQHYGIDSEKLAEFGVQPFRGRRRSKVEPPPVETPQAG
jgi:hypothetical protein